MLPLAVGLTLGVLAGATAGALLASYWRLARIGAIGAPLLGGLGGFCANALLQLLGAGDLQFLPRQGTIDWIPVVSTMFASAAVGLIGVGCIGLMRVGARGRR